ncbi:MAG: hypothetical protein RR100_05005, partial [Comamonas sp.]
MSAAAGAIGPTGNGAALHKTAEGAWAAPVGHAAIRSKGHACPDCGQSAAAGRYFHDSGLCKRLR